MKRNLFSRTDKIKAIKRLRDLAEESGVIYHPAEPIINLVSENEKLLLNTSKTCYVFDALLMCIGRIP